METATESTSSSSKPTSSSTSAAKGFKNALPSIDYDSLTPDAQKKWVIDTFGDEFYEGDYEITLAFVRENWKILKYAKEELRNNEEILMYARKFLGSLVRLFLPSSNLTSPTLLLLQFNGNSHAEWQRSSFRD